MNATDEVTDLDQVGTVLSLIGRRDHAALIRSLDAALPEAILQLVGDGLLDAIRQGAAGANEIAERLMGALQERGWDGDEELIEDLEAVLGIDEPNHLRRVPIDLEELAAAREGSSVTYGGIIDLIDGTIYDSREHRNEMYGDPEDRADDGERFVEFDCTGAESTNDDIRAFVGSLEDRELADVLVNAAAGTEGSSAFFAELDDHGDALAQWTIFVQERKRGRARLWLADMGLAPTLRAFG